MRGDLETVQERYERWWAGKLINRNGWTKLDPPRRCIGIEWTGPPSGVYGSVRLVFEGGVSTTVCEQDPKAFKPRKVDVGVVEEGAQR